MGLQNTSHWPQSSCCRELTRYIGRCRMLTPLSDPHCPKCNHQECSRGDDPNLDSWDIAFHFSTSRVYVEIYSDEQRFCSLPRRRHRRRRKMAGKKGPRCLLTCKVVHIYYSRPSVTYWKNGCTLLLKFIGRGVARTVKERDHIDKAAAGKKFCRVSRMDRQRSDAEKGTKVRLRSALMTSIVLVIKS